MLVGHAVFLIYVIHRNRTPSLTKSCLVSGQEGIAILMVPENSDLMRHYEEAAARGELEEEYVAPFPRRIFVTFCAATMALKSLLRKRATPA